MYEYQHMKHNYIIEYQENYQINLNVKEENITSFMETIEEKENSRLEVQKLKE